MTQFGARAFEATETPTATPTATPTPTPEDFTQRATCQYCGFYDGATADQVAADQCASVGGDDSPTKTGSPTRIISGLPTGSPGTDEAISFDDGDYYELDDSGGAADNLEPSGADFTVIGWVYLDDVGLEEHLFSKWASNEGWKIATYYNDPDTNWYGYVDSAYEEAATALSADTWYLLSLRWDDDTDKIELFLNGEDDCDGTCSTESTGITQNSASVMWGWSVFVSVDEYDMCVFSEALTDLEQCEFCRFGSRGTATDRGAACGSCTWF
jgi:hypothetical protein